MEMKYEAIDKFNKTVEDSGKSLDWSVAGATEWYTYNLVSRMWKTSGVLDGR
jgi:hypothetical protein